MSQTKPAEILKDILEPEVQNNELVDYITKYLVEQFPIQGKTNTLELVEVSADENKVDPYDIPAQKDMKLKGGSWVLPIYGHLRLRDNKTGKVIDESKRIKILSLPRLTNRYSMIIDGSEYQTINQLRLKPGIYTRVKENGELESWFDLEKGYNFKMIFDPESRLFYLLLANRKFKLYTILNALGFPDEEMKKAWGLEVFNANKASGINREVIEIPDLVEKITRKRPLDYQSAITTLKTYLDNTKVSAATTKLTLGEGFEKVNEDTLFATSKKILGVLRGEQSPDERDSLVFKNLYTPTDLLAAYMDKQKPKILVNLATRTDNKSSIKDIISSDTYTKPLKKFYTTGDLSSTPEQTNPISILSEWRKTTVMGTGGVQSSHAITMGVRDVHPSQLGFLDPIATPESGKVGVTLPLAVDIKKHGDDIKKSIITPTGESRFLTPLEVSKLTLGFPDQWEWVNGKPKAKASIVKAMSEGQVQEVPSKKIDGWIQNTWSIFSWPTNLIPFMQSDDAVRASFGAKMGAQAIPLDKTESPLIESKIYGSKENISFEQAIGRYLAPMVPEEIKSATVTKVTDDYIYLKPDNSKESVKIGLFNQFPLNRETFLQSTPRVKVGEKVKANQLLAFNNFQDPKDGSLSVGLNVNVAYMSWKGLNYEDSCVITESLSKDFTSTKIIPESIIVNKEGIQNLKKFRLYYPALIPDSKAGNYDPDGIIKVGAEIDPEDVIVAYLEPKDFTDEEKILRSMNKSMYMPYANRSLTWHGGEKAKVIYVNRLSGGKIVVHLKTSNPMVVGDKIAGRHGNKSIVSRIIPDEEAPHTTDGKRIDLILSPNGVPGRMNTGQILETAAGKIATAKGQKFYVENFSGKNYLKEIQSELKSLGIKADEVLLDGKDGKPFKNPIFTGNQYIMKLMHTVEHKAKARSYGTYSVEEQPSHGAEPGQKIDPLTTFGLLAHGARENLSEFAALKSQRNDEIWAAIQAGRPIPPPQANFAFEKLLVLLKGLGVNVNKNGTMMSLEPTTDDQTLEMSNGELTDAGKMLIGKNLSPIAGGLFDKDVTGGMKGKKWSHITLADKMPHPLYEKPILTVLGLSKPLYENIIKEKAVIPKTGETGVRGIEHALASINVKEEMRLTRAALAKAPRAEVDKLNRRYRYLEALDKFNKRPDELYMIRYFPVIPPAYRPAFSLASGDINSSPINYNYRDLAVVNNGLKDYKTLGLEAGFGGDARFNLYKEMSYTIGTDDDPTPGKKEKKEGILVTIAGKQSPKYGYAHNKLWGKRQDLSARSTITLDPALGLDEIGLPETLYKKVFLPFAVRELVNQGFTPLQAREEVRQNTHVAKIAFAEVMKNRPVLMNRAPSLHKHSIQAHMARPVTGSSIKLNPLIVKGYNADFDGDTMSVHVPVGPKAVEEAFTMLPSRNIWQAGSKSNIPAGAFSKDYQLGLWHLTRELQATNMSFKSLAEANAAHRANKLELNHTFMLAGVRTSLGRQMVLKTLPKGMQLEEFNTTVDKKVLKKILDRIAKEYPNDFGPVIDALKDMAIQFGHEFGSTVSINDFDIDRSWRDKIVKHFKDVEDPKWSREQKVKHWLKAQALIEEAQNKYVKETGKSRGLFDMLESGAESKHDSVRQILTAPGIKIDVHGKAIPTPITKSLAEGLDLGSYWMSLYGARKGMVDRAINTEQSGAINKSLLGVTKNLLIVEADCGTDDGVEIELSDQRNLQDRFLPRDIPGVGKRNDEIDNTIINKARSKGMLSLLVRSPLTCESINGICQKCYGLAEDGNLVAIGTNVGIKEGQAMTERSTQLTMKAFHSGGSATAEQDVLSGFPKMEQIVKVPEIVAGKATLASVKGVVHRIEKSPIGGVDVYVAGVKHHVPYGRVLVVKKGDMLEEGDSISAGSVKPQELMEYKGYQAARLQMVDDLEGVFKKEGLGKKTFETVIRGIANNAEIDEAPEDSEYIRGDIAPLSKLVAINKQRKLDGEEEIKYTPYFKSIDTLAMDNPDWLSKLTVNRIRETLKDGAALGAASNLHGVDPMPSYLYGTEFNKNVDFTQKRFY